MKKRFKAVLLGLSVLVALSGSMLAGPSPLVSAKSNEQQMTEQTFKKKAAELAKVRNSLEKKQNKLLVVLQMNQEDIIDQFLELLGDPTAMNPTTVGTTHPTVTSATYNTDEQMTSFYFETLENIADQDPSVADYFDHDVLDELSPHADELLTLYAKAEKLSASYDKLDLRYNDYVMQSKYSEALNVLVQQNNLDIKLNKIYNSMLSIQDEISSMISDGLSHSDDESKSDEHGSHQNNNNHDGNNKKGK